MKVSFNEGFDQTSSKIRKIIHEILHRAIRQMMFLAKPSFPAAI
jgi:hypothetical protein